MRVGGGVPTFFLCLLEEEEEEARGRVFLKRLSDLRFMHMHGTWLSYSGQLLAIATEGIAELTDPWPRITNMCGCFQCPSGVLTGSPAWRGIPWSREFNWTRFLACLSSVF